ncbi:MAG: DUF72 domain-containing protein, partial [Candidatus Bathyarchaeia archaeon]
MGLSLIKVGTCGWGRIYQYAPPSVREGRSSLQTYAGYFDVVEVDSSFYSYHKKSTYEGWRGSVPPNFEFTVKCHKDVTHRFMLKPTRECLSAFNSVLEGALACDAKAVLLQTPSSLKPSKEALSTAEEFFRSVDTEQIPVVWETRGEEWLKNESLQLFRDLLERYSVTHVTDILKAEPSYISRLAYFRLHGLPGYNLNYSYSNEDLKRILVKSRENEVNVKGGDVYLFFNNYAMYSDGVRFKRLLEGVELGSPFGP